MSRFTRAKSPSDPDPLLEIFLSRVKHNSQEGLEIGYCDVKGRTVKTTRLFKKGEHLCNYVGDLISRQEGLEREKIMDEKKEPGNFMFFFRAKSQNLCLDATQEPHSPMFGRLVNHAKRGNCFPKVIILDGEVYLCFIADRDIKKSEDIEYNYGERRREIIKDHPFLK